MSDDDETDDSAGGRTLLGGIMPDNVLVFPSLREMKESGGPVSRKPRDYAQCQHGHGVIVDGVDRVVTCKKCSKPVDAFEALLQLAVHWDWEHTRHAKAEASKDAEKVLADLKRLKDQRARARNTGHLAVSAVKEAFTKLQMGLQHYVDSRTRGKADDNVVEAYQNALYMVRSMRTTLLAGRTDYDP